MIENPHLRKFLAISRIEELWKAWLAATATPLHNQLSLLIIIFAIGAALLPFVAVVYADYFVRLDSTTVAIGIATLLAVLFRLNSQLRFEKVDSWRHSLRLTHTAFGLGCIPVVAVLVFYPEALTQVHEQITQSSSSDGAQEATFLDLLRFTFIVAFWAALTEEFIYRGMVISAIRRFRGASSQRSRDVVAVIFSSLLFGLVHYSAWGFPIALAVSGLGIGFGIAYIAIGERILPLLVYHFLFDFFSLWVAIIISR